MVWNMVWNGCLLEIQDCVKLPTVDMELRAGMILF